MQLGEIYEGVEYELYHNSLNLFLQTKRRSCLNAINGSLISYAPYTHEIYLDNFCQITVVIDILSRSILFLVN